MSEGFRVGRGLRPIHRLPVVARSKAKLHGTFVDVFQRYLRLPMEPLLVSADLLTPVTLGVDAAIHLDALLSWSVIEGFPCSTIHDEHSATSAIPIPVRLEWVDARGLPLWAASDLHLDGEWLRSTSYVHKRYPSDRVEWTSRPNALTSAGRYKDARIPFTRYGSVEGRLTGACIGNRAEVERLLADVTHVGKKTAHGAGRVGRWTVEPLAIAHDEALARILDARFVPVDYYVERGTLDRQGPDLQRRLLAHRGWTPPYWHAPFASTVVAPALPT